MELCVIATLAFKERRTQKLFFFDIYITSKGSILHTKKETSTKTTTTKTPKSAFWLKMVNNKSFVFLLFSLVAPICLVIYHLQSNCPQNTWHKIHLRFFYLPNPCYYTFLEIFLLLYLCFIFPLFFYLQVHISLPQVVRDNNKAGQGRDDFSSPCRLLKLSLSLPKKRRNKD